MSSNDVYGLSDGVDPTDDHPKDFNQEAHRADGESDGKIEGFKMGWVTPKPKILTEDDDIEFRAFKESYLKSEGFDVVFPRSAEIDDNNCGLGFINFRPTADDPNKSDAHIEWARKHAIDKQTGRGSGACQYRQGKLLV